MLINETQQKWSNIISEELGVKDANKLNWMSKVAQIHELYEAQQNPTPNGDMGIYSTPLNTMGMGNPMMPEPAGGFKQTTGIGNTGADFHNPLYRNGSGDIPMSTLNMALEVAAMTIGLELVPVIPAPGPFAMLSYMDFPYAGGKLGRLNETALDGKGEGADNKPIYIKFNGIMSQLNAIKNMNLAINEAVTIKAEDENQTLLGTFKAKYIGFSRIDNNLIVEVVSVQDAASHDISIAEFFAMEDAIYTLTVDATSETIEINKSEYTVTGDANGVTITNDVTGATANHTYDIPLAADADYTFRIGGENVTVHYDSTQTTWTITDQNVMVIRPELVAAAADHVQEFSNFMKNNNGDPMTRAENETGVGNTIGARMFTKLVQMGSYEVTGSVTRQQLQDMPLYGVDVIGKILESMQNEISQAINNRILDRLFKLGVTNAQIQHEYQGVDLNLYINGDVINHASKPLSEICAENHIKFVNIHDENAAETWGNVQNARVFAAAENVTTNQRRIMSRLLAAANLIANVSRRGRATWAVTNTQILSALQDASAFVVAPMTNTLTQDGSQSLYFAGSLAGLNIYVDPYMTWNDTRICVGRKASNNNAEVGVVFMPYILCDTVQTVVEGTMAPKLLCNSRFAIVDAGFHPEQSYFVFVVDCQEGII